MIDTTIGTPLSATALKVMLLGGGELGKELVIALQRFGVETIVVDSYPNAPAMQVAHKSYVLDMTDASSLTQLIHRVTPHIIVPEIEAIATEVLLAIEQQGTTRVIPNARAVNLTMNRPLLRRLAAEELKLPTANYKFAASLAELEIACQEIGFPCFIKPLMSSSGKGQSRIGNTAECAEAWESATTQGRVKQSAVIIEADIDFEFEITLLTVRAYTQNGVIETYFCNPIGHTQVAGDYVESWQPQPLSAMARTRAEMIARTITTNLGGLGVFGVELFVKGDQVWFSEVSPRPHDTGMVTLITQYQNQFELHVRALLGLPVDTRQKEVGASHVIYAEKEGKGLIYSNLARALSVPHSDLRLFAKPEGYPKRRMGVALAYSSTIAEASACASRVADEVIVN